MKLFSLQFNMLLELLSTLVQYVNLVTFLSGQRFSNVHFLT